MDVSSLSVPEAAPLASCLRLRAFSVNIVLTSTSLHAHLITIQALDTAAHLTDDVPLPPFPSPPLPGSWAALAAVRHTVACMQLEHQTSWHSALSV